MTIEIHIYSHYLLLTIPHQSCFLLYKCRIGEVIFARRCFHNGNVVVLIMTRWKSIGYPHSHGMDQNEYLGHATCGSGEYEPRYDKTNTITCASSEDSDQPGHPPSLMRVFACAQWVAKHAGWSEFSLGAQVILLVLSCRGSYKDGNSTCNCGI